MGYEVIARKYRPQTFSEVAGQDIIARTLTNAIKRARLAQSFLLTGPSGVGKTTMARILAKALCCSSFDEPTPEPCGTCDNCKMIADSNHPDVYEIDAATHNGVDDVRQLAEDATFAPNLARRRVFIMDEAHMLSSSAWNALLKLIEEPPEHVTFMFATTEIDKVPATVANRCQRFDFRAIDRDTVARTLGSIAEREGASVPQGLLYRIARAAGGGMREAQTLLDQLIAIGGDEITEDDFNLLLGAANNETVIGWCNLALGGDGPAALAILDEALSKGAAPGRFLEQLLDRLRQVLLLSTCGVDHPAVIRLGTVDEDLRRLAEQHGTPKILRACQILIKAGQHMRSGVEPRLHLEMATVHLADLGDLLDLATLRRQLQAAEEAAPHPR